jgi:hypothetical protein
MKLRGASCGGGAEFSHFYFSGSHPVACIGWEYGIASSDLKMVEWPKHVAEVK